MNLFSSTPNPEDLPPAERVADSQQTPYHKMTELFPDDRPAHHNGDVDDFASAVDQAVEASFFEPSEMQAPAEEEPTLQDEEDDLELPDSEDKPKSKSRAIRICLKVAKYVLLVLLVAAVLVGCLFAYLTITEYRPAYAENALYGAVNIERPLGGVSEGVAPVEVVPLSEQTFKIVSFNTGYAGLGRDADFFMDGGSHVNPESEETVVSNMRGIANILKRFDADFYFLQEVDTDSSRTYGRNQWLYYEAALKDYESRFAMNYSCSFVPYPVTDMIGKVHSGIVTLSRYNIDSATRFSLPCPFTWPTRVANLKRCLLVTRVPIGDGGQELVLVNLHLEAYDDGEGKKAQTEQLMKFVQQEYAKGNYVIAGGDFNQVFPGTLVQYPIKNPELWSPGRLEPLPEGWLYAFGEKTCRLLNQPYAPGDRDTQYYVIDGFLYSPNVECVRVETGDERFTFSDHNPVVMEFRLLSE